MSNDRLGVRDAVGAEIVRGACARALARWQMDWSRKASSSWSTGGMGSASASGTSTTW